MKPIPVKLTWVDSGLERAGWEENKEKTKTSDQVFDTVGWLYDKDDEWYYLANTVKGEMKSGAMQIWVHAVKKVVHLGTRKVIYREGGKGADEGS